MSATGEVTLTNDPGCWYCAGDETHGLACEACEERHKARQLRQCVLIAKVWLDLNKTPSDEAGLALKVLNHAVKSSSWLVRVPGDTDRGGENGE